MRDANPPVPSGLDHEMFVATPLTAGLGALDHAAYVASPDVIRVHSDGRWPADGFTWEDDLALIARHEADHAAGCALTFVLLDPARTQGLGCLYVNPLGEFLARVGAGTGASSSERSFMVTFWIRQDRHDTDLPGAVVEAVDAWLQRAWPDAPYLFRILPGELTSRAALERLGLVSVEVPLPDGERPYLWYRSGSGPASWSRPPASRSPDDRDRHP